MVKRRYRAFNLPAGAAAGALVVVVVVVVVVVGSKNSNISFDYIKLNHAYMLYYAKFSSNYQLKLPYQ